jgi:fluoride ion exporter CrcB/FEX
MYLLTFTRQQRKKGWKALLGLQYRLGKIGAYSTTSFFQVEGTNVGQVNPPN